MRIFTTLLLSLCLPLLSIGQQTIDGSITFAGIQRDYILYVPEIYTPGEAVPLILNFHGYTSNAFEQLNYGDFRPVSYTHLRTHETVLDLVCRLLLEKKKTTHRNLYISPTDETDIYNIKKQ